MQWPRYYSYCSTPAGVAILLQAKREGKGKRCPYPWGYSYKNFTDITQLFYDLPSCTLYIHLQQRQLPDFALHTLSRIVGGTDYVNIEDAS